MKLMQRRVAAVVALGVPGYAAAQSGAAESPAAAQSGAQDSPAAAQSGAQDGPAAASSNADAAEPPLVSADNPGFTNVTRPAPKLRLITEQSVGLAFADDATVLALPRVLGRVGVAEFLEVRTFLPSAVVQFPQTGDTAIDVDQVGLGVLAGGPLAPSLGASITPVVFAPIGDDDVGAQAVEGFVQGTVSWSIVEQVGLDLGALGGWVQVPQQDGGSEPRARFLGGALVSVSPTAVVSLYAESFVECVDAAGCEPILGGGAAWWIVPPAQVHVAANSGVGDDAPPPALSVGSVVRWW